MVFCGAHSPVPVVSGPSNVCTLPGAWDVVSGHPEVCTLPGASYLGSMPPTPLWEHRVARWRGGWSCCCRRIPQTAPKCLFFFLPLFLFQKILLLNPASPYKEGPVLSHSPPLQLDQGLSRSGPNTAQLSTFPTWYPQSLWVYHFVLIPLPATSSNQVSLGAAETLFGRGGSR